MELRGVEYLFGVILYLALVWRREKKRFISYSGILTTFL